MFFSSTQGKLQVYDILLYCKVLKFSDSNIFHWKMAQASTTVLWFWPSFQKYPLFRIILFLQWEGQELWKQLKRMLGDLVTGKRLGGVSTFPRRLFRISSFYYYPSMCLHNCIAILHREQWSSNISDSTSASRKCWPIVGPIGSLSTFRVRSFVAFSVDLCLSAQFLEFSK